MVCRKPLHPIFFLLFSSPFLFEFNHHPNVFINLQLDSIHRSDLPLLKGRILILSNSTSWAKLSTFDERVSSLSSFSSTLLFKAFWVVIKSLRILSNSEVEFLVLG